MNARTQAGITIWGMLIIVMVLGIFTLVGTKLAPIYLNYFSVKQSLESMEGPIKQGTTSKREITKLLLRRLEINEVDDMLREHSILPKNEPVSVTKKGDAIEVRIAYAVRKQIIANIDAVVTFDDKIEVIPTGI
jgi:outer membrane lipopolysaccharide assembly protein LptE/RlpB